jgi:hypothetical protein
MLCISIRKVLVSNYRWDIGYPNRFLVALHSPSRHVPEQYFN